MKILENKEIRRIFIIYFITIIIFITFFTIAILNQNRQYRKILNEKINNIVNEIMYNYPEVKEEEIVKILNSTNSKKENVLFKYGYTGDVAEIKSIENNLNTNLIINITIIVAFGMCSYAICRVYIWKQDKKIKDIDEYLKQINNKNYTLKIKDNGEEELSKLRNELYKTTVFLKETAENSKKEKEQLSDALADISHQLKTPLTSITIMLDNITENPNMDENTKSEFIREINKQIDWINSLVISLLKLAKFDAGAIKMNNKKIKVIDLINEVISNLAILIDVKNIEIVTNLDENSTFSGDYKWQLEAISNIVKNAVEHSNDNSKVYIDVENTSLFLKIKIRDEGSGIDKKDLKHIFDRFYKAENSSEDSIGIGLSLAKTIIEKNNGYIKVDSKENEGTTFEIKYLK